MQTGLIYCHINKTNNKRYIGLTHYSDDPNKRWRDGRGYLNKHHKIFAAAIKKYGGLDTGDSNGEHIILVEGIATLEEANALEKYGIAYYHTYVGDPECGGYNATVGGDGSTGHIISEEERQRRREARLGKKLSEETKQKMSKTRKGKPQNMTDKKIAQIKAMNASWKGQHHTAEAIEKIRQANLRRVYPSKKKQKLDALPQDNSSQSDCLDKSEASPQVAPET